MPDDIRVDDESDDLDAHLASRLSDPRFRAAYEDAQTRSGLLAACVAHRKALDLSQAAVADLMGTTQSAVSEFESGGTDPRLSTLQRYARAIRSRLELRLCNEVAGVAWGSSHVAQVFISVEGKGWSQYATAKPHSKGDRTVWDVSGFESRELKAAAT